MNQQVKLIVAEQPNGQKQQFMIYTQKIVGEGSYGTVKMAIETTRPQKQLVAKIIPYVDEKKREKIQKQLDILKKLPIHQNLVTVQPIKCFSSKNYYIFMEYCKDGTLEDLMKKKPKFTEQEILDFFQQFMAGYKVLYDRKILHQDIKPDNILIRKNIYKITDFGFSIFHEGYKHTNTRQGTLPYMPLEKLTEKQYYANSKSDVYSLGVILFRMIVGNHPYVINKPKDPKNYIMQVKKNKLQFQPNIIHTFSIKFQYFFDMVLKMIAKEESNRLEFEDIFQYIENEQMFSKIRQRKKQPSTIINLEQKKKVMIVEQSNAMTIPFGIPESEQRQYKKNAMEVLKNKSTKYEKDVIERIENYIIKYRIILYFFDRLTRRIYIEKMKKVQYFAPGEQKIILALLLLCKKIAENILKLYRNPGSSNVFKDQQMKIYRRSDHTLINLIQNDENYLDDLVIQTLTQNFNIKIQDQRQLLDQSKKQFKAYIQILTKILEGFLRTRALLMKTDKSIVTIRYVLNGLEILNDFQTSIEKAEELQSYFRYIESEDPKSLLEGTLKALTERGIQFCVDQGELVQNN